MKTDVSIIAIAELVFVFTLIFGLSLSRNLTRNDPRELGKPVAGALPTVHKVAALATIIMVAVAIRNLHRGMEFRSIELSAVSFTALLFLLLFVTGTLLSLGKAASAEVHVVHEVVAVLAIISTSGAIYLLARWQVVRSQEHRGSCYSTFATQVVGAAHCFGTL